MKRNLIAFVVLALFAQNLLAGGWTQKKGEGYFSTSLQATLAREFFSDNGDVININGAGTLLGNYIWSTYAEYGIHDRFTAIGYFPFLVRNTVNEGIGELTGEVLQEGLENTAIGDFDIGFRYRLYQKGSFVLSASAFLGLPLGVANHPDLLNSGDGEFNQRVQVEFGYGKSDFYLTGYVGFNNRTEGFSEEFRYEGEVGLKMLKQKQLVLGLKITGVESFDNGTPSPRGNGLFANNVEYISPQLFAFYEIDEKWGFSTRVGGAFTARNALAAPGIEFGAFYKLKKS